MSHGLWPHGNVTSSQFPVQTSWSNVVVTPSVRCAWEKSYTLAAGCVGVSNWFRMNFAGSFNTRGPQLTKLHVRPRKTELADQRLKSKIWSTAFWGEEVLDDRNPLRYLNMFSLSLRPALHELCLIQPNSFRQWAGLSQSLYGEGWRALAGITQELSPSMGQLWQTVGMGHKITFLWVGLNLWGTPVLLETRVLISRLQSTH